MFELLLRRTAWNNLIPDNNLAKHFTDLDQQNEQFQNVNRQILRLESLWNVWSGTSISIMQSHLHRDSRENGISRYYEA